MKKNNPSFLGILLVLGIIATVLFASAKLSVWIGIEDGQLIILTVALILIGGFFVFGWIQSSVEKTKKNKIIQPPSVKRQSWTNLTTQEKFDEIWNLIQGGFILLCILVIFFLFFKACISK